MAIKILDPLRDIDPVPIAEQWLIPFSAALISGAVGDAVACFQPDGWLKDSLVFSWASRSLHGHDLIHDYLASSAETTLANLPISNVQLDTTTAGLKPTIVPIAGKIGGIGIRFTFTFETPTFLGKSNVLLRKLEGQERYLAIFVFMAMEEIKGYSPCGPESGVYGGHTLAWGDIWSERKSQVEADPYVLIVGAGQTGLNMGARLKSLDIPTLIIDKLPRVGDQWRIRYPTLTLHTPRTHHTILFQPYPKNWPIFTPRDKLADWLEQYPTSQDLVVWTNTSLESSVRPTYDEKTKRWHLAVTRNGKEVIIRPAHIIMATSTLGSPRSPIIKDESLFSGVTYHACNFQGGKAHEGKRVLIVGAGNTGADIAQDCVMQGAKEVYLLQRSSTCAVSAEALAESTSIVFPEGQDLEVTDFKYMALPIGLQRQWAIEDREKREKRDEELFRKLTSKGVKLNQGRDGSGHFLLIYERWGGFWVDVGIGELIDDGKVKVINGVEVDHFLENGVVFTDGKELEVDIVIYATGYNSVRDDLRPVFGEHITAKTRLAEVNEEDEVGVFNPSGQPGLWFAGGNFGMSRAFSKQLGLQIQARYVGLYSDEPTTSA